MLEKARFYSLGGLPMFWKKIGKNHPLRPESSPQFRLDGKAEELEAGCRCHWSSLRVSGRTDFPACPSPRTLVPSYHVAASSGIGQAGEHRDHWLVHFFTAWGGTSSNCLHMAVAILSVGDDIFRPQISRVDEMIGTWIHSVVEMTAAVGEMIGPFLKFR